MLSPGRVILCLVACLGFAGAAIAGEIHETIERGDEARATELLRADPGLIGSRAENPTRDLPLHTAAIHNRVEIARMLLGAGSVLEAEDSDGSTPLHDAAVGRKREMVEFLLANGADVNRRDRNGAYALSFAVAGGDSLIVRKILEAGADLNFLPPASGVTLMHTACSRGLFWFADRLLADGADINTRNGRGETPLNWACQGRFPDRVRQTLARGGNPALADTFGMTPLHVAAMNWSAQPEMVRLLLARGADVHARDHSGRTPLFGAAARGDTVSVGMLLDQGAKADVKSDDGRTPLIAAADGGKTAAVALLLRAGARTDDRNPTFGWTALHEAAVFGWRDLARELVDHGADLNATDSDGRTPLVLAQRSGQTELAEYLRAHRARGEAKDESVSLASLAGVGPGSADIWSLGHSSWAIKTRNHFLVFDYGDIGRRADEPCLHSGDINPAELAGQKVTVFTSHEHGDHYLPAMFDWRAQVPNINYVLGFRPQNLPNNPSYEYIGPHETKIIDGMKVTTLQANDAGVGFLVEADGVSIFHPGDHANMQEDMSGPYREEIDALVQKGAHPDIAFSPLVGCGGGTQMAAALGARYVIETMKPRLLFPMHGGHYGTRYVSFIATVGEGLQTQTKMLPVLCKGDHFRYRNGAAS
jgi:ankyrin repeat protein